MSDLGEPIAAPTSERRADEHRAELVRRILLGEITPDEACEEANLTHAELTEWVKLYRRAVRRAVDDQFATALAAQGIDVDDFVLSGNLESLALADLFETIHQGRKDAHIRIDHDGEEAHVWCIDGEVVDARAGELVGKPAVYRLLSLGAGRLRVDFSRVERERTLICPIPTLLSTAADRGEQCATLRAQIGARSVYLPQLRPDQLPPEPPERRRVLELFDGASNVDEVVAKSALPDLETLQAISTLVAEGWLSKAEPHVRWETRTLPSSGSFPQFAAPQTSELPAASFSQTSFRPVSASLWASLSRPPRGQRWRHAAALGVLCAIPLAFVLGIWSARPAAPAPVVSASAAVTTDAALGAALCGAGMSFVPATAPLRPFCLATREVSAGEYQACVSAGPCEAALIDARAASATSAPGAGCNAGRADRERQPINCVTARQAEQYCGYRGARLPLESEWEFAARTRATALEGLTGGEGDLSEWTRGEALPRELGRDGALATERYVVLEGPKRDEAARVEGAPTRVYMSASSQGRSVGFRCALSLETSATLPGTAALRPPE